MVAYPSTALAAAPASAWRRALNSRASCANTFSHWGSVHSCSSRVLEARIAQYSDQYGKKADLRLDKGLHVSVAERGSGGGEQTLQFENHGRGHGGQGRGHQRRHEDAERGEIIRERPGGMARIARQGPDHGPAAAPRFKDAPARQRPQRRAHRGPVHAESLGEAAFGREALKHPPAAFQESAFQLSFYAFLLVHAVLARCCGNGYGMILMPSAYGPPANPINSFFKIALHAYNTLFLHAFNGKSGWTR